MISAGQVILLVSVVGLTAGVYFFGDFKGPDEGPVATTQHEGVEGTFDYGLYREMTVASFDAVTRKEVEKLEKDLAGAETDTAKAGAINALIAYFESKDAHVIAARYSADLAEMRNTAEVWNKTGDNYLSVLYGAQLPPDVQAFVLESAQASYQKALELQPDNVEAKISLATTYMEATGATANPMQGVTMLLDVVREDSANVRAQLILGRFGIVSGQFDKAIERLEKVVALDPDNTEAYFYLGEAHNGLGNVAKAIEYFEKCRQMVDDPEFRAQLDAYIEQLKNS